jgi:hypothetical protein
LTKVGVSLFRCPKWSQDQTEDSETQRSKQIDTEADHEVFKRNALGYRGGTCGVAPARQKKNLSEKLSAKIKRIENISKGEYRPRRECGRQ